MLRPLGISLAVLSLAVTARAASNPVPVTSSLDLAPDRIIISVKDQRLMVVRNNKPVAVYPVSTSKYGLGDNWGHMTTPLGYLQVVQKIGDNAPSGAVFHNRRLTGEVLRPNAPGRDPIVTRIIWLRGLEAQNAHAYRRCIYIHGTAEERYVGQPASFGCIRMKSKDVTALYNQVPVGAIVQIIPDRLPSKSQVHRAAMATSLGAGRNAEDLSADY